MTEAVPQRIRIPDPVGDAFVDYLEVRIAQTLARKIHRQEEGRQLAFVLGLATSRWVYIAQQDITTPIVNPTEFVAAIKGRLSTLSPEDLGQLISIPLDSDNYSECRRARRTMAEVLAVE